jgi:hypothetical protein
MTIQANIAEVAALTEHVKAHPMCARFKNTDTHIYAFYPLGFKLDAVRVCKSGGMANALRLALVRMEKDWAQA